MNDPELKHARILALPPSPCRREPDGLMKGGGIILMIIAVIVILILIVIITVILTIQIEMVPGHVEMDRIECPGLLPSECMRKLCVFHKVTDGPSCYMEKDSFGYTVVNVTEESDGPLIYLRSISHETPYGNSIENVLFKLTYISENILRFQFKDANKQRYEVPVQKEFPLLQNKSDVDVNNLNYSVTHSTAKDLFHFVVRRLDGETIWDTRLGALLLSSQYLQIGTYLPSENVYGLGEHVHRSLRHDLNYKSWPMFARDAFPDPDKGYNLYGVHPFYTCLEKSGASHGVLLLNSNAMEATLMPAPAISFRTIGGILDFFIFVGDNPEHVIQLYTSLIGRPMMPPYWSLGFQLCRYGYDNISTMMEAVERTENAKIPQAVQYLDIDHMDKNMDFTYSETRFPDLPDVMEKLRKDRGLKWIIILDPAIAAVTNYTPYDSGLESSVYVKRPPLWSEAMFPKGVRSINVTAGKVWPDEYVVFPDFFMEETKEWWKDNIVEYQEILSFDGLWIDMNEPANFGTNEDKPDYCSKSPKSECWSLHCPKSVKDDPPYNPLQETGTKRLSEKTLCMESIQGHNDTEYVHYDVHSLYGWSQTQITLEAAQEATGTRSLVISRSTYPSSGRYAGHWLGDNTSNFEHLRNSIIGIMEFNLFGIPYIGADVCGFFGDADAELCKRWMQLGAFYPYFRNHNAKDQKPQDPAFFGEEVATYSRKAVERRITLNPYLYTLFYRAHVDGSTVVRPVFHEFPKDEITWNLDKQFMWGKSLLISPIVEPNKKTVAMYLPEGEWWHFLYEKSRKEKFTQQFTLQSEADEYTPLHVRGGTILPVAIYNWTHYPEDENVTRRDMDLYIFPEGNKSSGELFMDDGFSKDTIENEAYALYTFSTNGCQLSIETEEHSNFKGPQPYLKNIFIFKVRSTGNITGGYDVTVDNELNLATITVQSQVANLTKLSWEDSDGNCDMLE